MTPVTPPPSPAGILLAAGSGSRFGGGKLVHPLPPDNVPIALAAWHNLTRAVADVTVVIRPTDTAVRAMFETAGARIVECARAAEGMGYSLACAVESTPSPGGWIIALGDMPTIRPETIAAIAAALAAGASIVVPAFDGRRGHPVGFSAAHGDAIRDLTGDEGARNILAAHPGEVVILPVNDPGILKDVDTRDDLARLAEQRPPA